MTTCKVNTDMRRLTTGILSEKCVVKQFRRCANVIECTYTNLNSTAYYTPSLYIAYFFLGYKPVQRVTVLNTVGNFNTMVCIIILYIISGPGSVVGIATAYKLDGPEIESR
jgi:hypothetical protein